MSNKRCKQDSNDNPGRRQPRVDVLMLHCCNLLAVSDFQAFEAPWPGDLDTLHLRVASDKCKTTYQDVV